MTLMTGLQPGVSVTAWAARDYRRDRLDASLRAAAEAGFEAVGFSPTWYVSSTDGDDLGPRPFVTPNDAMLLQGLQTASDLGLAAMLKPHVDVGDSTTWRGAIVAREPAPWWERYAWMIGHYAELAERAGVKTFVIGTELEALTTPANDEQWRLLISDVRARFSGTVTYTTNELHDADRVGFWDALDCIGLSVYPTLAPDDTEPPTSAALRDAWAPQLAAMRALHDHWERPVLVAEIGFRSSVGGLYQPWDWERRDEPDPDRQAAAYDASYESLSAADFVTGVYWWDWPADLEGATEDPTGYTAYGKPALAVAQHWNGRLASDGKRARPRPLASVVVPVRNGAGTLAECLEALLGQTYPSDRTEIIAVDNASTDRTAQVIRSLPCRYVYEPQIGRSYARNAGIAASRGEVIAFTDADCVANPDWLTGLVAALDSTEASGVAGEILTLDPETAAQRYVRRRYPSHQRTALALSEPFAITANVAVRRDVFRQIGAFDPAFVTAEDVDFGWRFFAAGLKMDYAPSATVGHRTRASAWQLCRQQFGYGYGRATLRERYALRPGYALPSNHDLSEAARRLWRGSEHSDPEDRTFALYDLAVMLSLRAGELRRNLEQSLFGRVAAGWSGASN